MVGGSKIKNRLRFMKDVQSKTDAFYHMINEGITTIFPIKTVRVHIRDKLWITDRVKSLIAQRQKAFAFGDRATKVVLRKKVIREIKKAKRSYTSKKIRKLQKSNPGKWHKEVRKFANMKKPDPTIHVSGIKLIIMQLTMLQLPVQLTCIWLVSPTLKSPLI